MKQLVILEIMGKTKSNASISNDSIYEKLVSMRNTSRQMPVSSEENEYFHIFLPIVQQILSEERAEKSFFDHYEDCFTFLYDDRKTQKKISDQLGFLRDRINLICDGLNAEDAFIERYAPEEKHAE